MVARDGDIEGDGDVAPASSSLGAVRGNSSPDGPVFPGGRTGPSQRMEVLGKFVAGVAHEFSNLVTVIVGVAELRAGSLPVDDPLARDFGEIRRAGERAARLVRRLIDFVGADSAEPEVLDACAHVRDAERILRRVIGGDVVLWLRVAAAHPWVRIAPTHLDFVLLTLAAVVRNAMSGGGAMAIECVNPPDSAGRWLEIRVGESGADPAAGARIRRSSSSAQVGDADGGARPWLASTRGVLEAVGGAIREERAPGKRPAIVVALPTVQPGAAGEAPQQGAREVSPDDCETVLIVEPDPAVRGICEEVLRTNGYDVLSAAGGDEARALTDAHGRRVGLVVMDSTQRESGGEALLGALRSRHGALRTLYLGGYNAPSADGVPGVMPDHAAGVRKPFAPAELLRGIRRALSVPDTGQEAEH